MSGPGAGGPPEHPPLEGGTLVLGTIALSLATFMNVLDTSIANVSIPAISGDLGVSPTQGTWVITSFAVANAIAVPLTGWLAQRFGSVRLFILSTLLFVIASWLCGLAPSIEMLILFRVMQGAVAGPMIPLSQTLLLASFPRAKAGTALAMWGMTTLVAPVMGPLLGGWITDNISWPWIFYINVPVGFLSIFLTWRIYAKRDTPTRRLPIDTLGLVLLIVWVGALQLTLDKGKELDWFSSTTIVVLALIAVVGFAYFLVWELTDAHPVVDITLFARRNFWVGTLAVSMGYGIFFGNVVLLPLWLQQFMGYTATWAGIATAPVGILALVFSPVVGKKIATTDPRKMVTFSFLGFAFVMWLRSQFTTSTDFQGIVIPVILQGLAMAFFFIPLVTVTLSGLPGHRIPAASGLSNFVRITAGALGVSVYTTLWENRAALHHARIAETLNQGNSAGAELLSSMSAQGFGREQVAVVIDRLANQQAYTMAFDDLSLASSLVFIALIPIVWLARDTDPKKRAKAGAQGGAEQGAEQSEDAASAAAGAH